MTILAIVPGKPKMCLQENLVDCTDCGGLPFSTIWYHLLPFGNIQYHSIKILETIGLS